MLLAAGALCGQAFEAVSIRTSPLNTGPIGRPSVFAGGPGSTDLERLKVSIYKVSIYNVKQLIVRAYNLTNDIQFFGLDKIPQSDKIPVPWIQVDNFDIIAKVPLGATKEQVPLMLQNILSDRFGLKVHFEKKEMPIYNLVVAKAVAKSKESPGPVLSSTVPDPALSSRLIKTASRLSLKAAW
jgi:uncharacterized protein (TIGR03435 family)